MSNGADEVFAGILISLVMIVLFELGSCHQKAEVRDCVIKTNYEKTDYCIGVERK